MRVAIGEFMHESNGFSEKPTGFDEFDIFLGEEVIARSRGILGKRIDFSRCRGVK